VGIAHKFKGERALPSYLTSVGFLQTGVGEDLRGQGGKTVPKLFG
jgi:hypothetical protein